MNNHDLIERIVAATDISKKDAKTALDTVFAAITAAVAKGDDTAIPGFGKFVVRQTAERKGRNPHTGAELVIPPSRKLAFTPAKAVKDALTDK